MNLNAVSSNNLCPNRAFVDRYPYLSQLLRCYSTECRYLPMQTYLSTWKCRYSHSSMSCVKEKQPRHFEPSDTFWLW